MNITYISVVIIYILFIVRYIKGKWDRKRFINELILFSAITAPGIMLFDYLINLSDFIFLIVGIFGLINYGLKKRDKHEILFLLYIASIFTSIIFNVSGIDNITVVSLQGFRLLLAFLALTFYNYDLDNNKNNFLESVCIYGIYLAIFSIIAFFFQGHIYDSSQYMWSSLYRGIHRAAGPFGESSCLGYFMFVLFICACYTLLEKNNAKKRYAIILLPLTFVCSVLSYTRITTISLLIIVLILVLYKMIKGMSLRSYFIILLFIITFILSVFFVPIINDFFVNRLLFDTSNGFNGTSSGRLDTWKNAFETYINNGNLIFGVGYKNGVLGDNILIMSLTQLGIFGCVSVILLVLSLLLFSYKTRNIYVFLIVLCMLIMGLSADVLTYYRPLSIIFIFFKVVSVECVYEHQEKIKYNILLDKRELI